jgi:hypothetical protein
MALSLSLSLFLNQGCQTFYTNWMGFREGLIFQMQAILDLTTPGNLKQSSCLIPGLGIGIEIRIEIAPPFIAPVCYSPGFRIDVTIHCEV